MVTLKRLFNSQAVQTASPGAALYTAPQYTRGIRPYLTFLNTDSSNAVTVSVYIVRNGQAASLDVAEAIWLTKTLGPLESKICHELATQVLEPGDMIYAVASAGTVTVHGSAPEVTT
jgi:hypothetical protein